MARVLIDEALVAKVRQIGRYQSASAAATAALEQYVAVRIKIGPQRKAKQG